MKRELTTWLLLLTACGSFSAIGYAATSITSSSALPATIIFTGVNPQSVPIVAGNSTATIIFTTIGGSTARTWQVQVQATSPNFASCPSPVAASTVQVSCTSATVTGGGQPGSGSCGGAFNLSTGLQTAASGIEGNGSKTYTVTLDFTFADSWSYTATSSACTLGLTYTITAN